MKWIDKMQRKFGRYAIPNLMNYIIGLNVIGFVLYMLNPIFLAFINWDMDLILRGQIWRLVSFLLMPPSTNLFSLLLFCLVYSMIGNTLERIWGSFRMNLYLFTGILGHILAGILIYFIADFNVQLSTVYLNSSLFFALAATFPDAQFYLYFVIPIKAKWMAILSGAMYVFEMIQGSWSTRILIVLSLINFVIFFFGTRDLNRIRPKEIKRRQEFKRQIRPNTQTKHKCAICGRTEKDGDDLEFRYCSKCEGAYEYCQDHLYTHKHVTTKHSYEKQ
ncbi:hypothetical protein NDGK_00592 [Clostridiales bacterium CHKCI001]|nr:hypothetical protein NDGK_00592 [Clostridiales bacterium CHKCI001]